MLDLTSRSDEQWPVWKKWSEVLLDLILPRRCAGCGRLGTWLCPACASRLPCVEPPICRTCGAPTAGLDVCTGCWQEPRRVDGIRAPYYFEGALRSMTHRFKYRHAQHLAEPLGLLIARYLDARPVPLADALVPVPLHLNRLRERGYNQSMLLARVVAAQTSLPVAEDCLERVRDTPPQMGLPAHQRMANVRGAFATRGKSLAGTRVLLIDDVCTTGATFEACAAALKRSGVKEVWAVALARARPSTQRPSV